jgi:uncharacterized protein YbaR (Trm112 family)
MKKDLMDILACPICKNPDLELHIFEEEEEIESGLIVCMKCFRYYPIRGSIPIMLPDDLRRKEEDVKFLKTFIQKIPQIIVQEGKPFKLNHEDV